MIISLTDDQFNKLAQDIVNLLTGDCGGDADDCHHGECPYIGKEDGGTTYCDAPSDSQQIKDLIKNSNKV